MRVLDELRGSFASASCASKRSSGATFMSWIFAFSSARLTANFATSFSRLALRLIWLFFAISYSSIHKRELEAFEKRTRLFVGPRRRVDDDVHAPNRFRLVVVDFDENDVFLQAERVVAASVEALGVQSAEVAHARKRHGDEAVKELVHLVLAQRDLGADCAAGRDLERRNRLLGARDLGLLARDRRQVVLRLLDLLGVRRALARTDVQNDLVDLRNLHDAGVAELLHQARLDLVVVALLETRNVVRIARLIADRDGRAGRLRFLLQRLLGFRSLILLPCFRHR